MGFSIRVVDADGDGVSGVSVMVAFYSMGGTLEETTDSDGWVTFEPAGDHVGCKVFIDGNKYDEIGYDDGDTFSYVLEDD
jgi:hypothetical protein